MKLFKVLILVIALSSVSGASIYGLSMFSRTKAEPVIQLIPVAKPSSAAVPLDETQPATILSEQS